MKRPAIFFDRDNTLIVSDGYLGDPAQVQLVPGAPAAVARAREFGFATVVFSNQSGVARGMFTEDDVRAVNARMDAMLLEENRLAVIDRHEFCPHHPEAQVEAYRQETALRKPGPGMILAAADAMALDLSRSWVIGDAPRDVQAGKAAGCRTVLVRNPDLTPSPAAQEALESEPDAVVTTLAEAMEFIAGQFGPPATDEPAEPGDTDEAAPVAAQLQVVAGEMDDDTTLPEPMPHHEGVDAPEPERSPGEPVEPATTVVPAAVSPTAPSVVRATATVPPSPQPSQPSSEPAPSPAAAPSLERTGQGREAPVLAPESPAAPTDSPAAPTDSPTKPEAPMASASSPASLTRLEELSEQILAELRRRHEQPQTEFSVSKLLAGIVQVIALAVMFLAYLNRGQGGVDLIILVAIYLQTLTVALLIMSRQQ